MMGSVMMGVPSPKSQAHATIESTWVTDVSALKVVSVLWQVVSWVKLTGGAGKT